MIYHNIDEFLKAKSIWDSVPAKIKKGVCYVLCGNKWIPHEKYLKTNPKPIYTPRQLDNPDTRLIYKGCMTAHTYSRKTQKNKI
jgi:hypothetical protein